MNLWCKFVNLNTEMLWNWVRTVLKIECLPLLLLPTWGLSFLPYHTTSPSSCSLPQAHVPLLRAKVAGGRGVAPLLPNYPSHTCLWAWLAGAPPPLRVLLLSSMPYQPPTYVLLRCSRGVGPRCWCHPRRWRWRPWTCTTGHPRQGWAMRGASSTCYAQ
jgi:hypothetical protein